MKNIFLTAICIYCAAVSCFAQLPCATDFVHGSLMQSDPDYRNKILNLENDIRRNSDDAAGNSRSGTYILPIVVHVIHLGEPIGTGSNISNAQIQGAIDGINDRWRNIIGNGADMEVQFCLASIDSAGNPTTGINRVDGSSIPNYLAFGINANNPPCGGADEFVIKNLSRWPVSRYYNIWVVNAICGGWGGWAYYPNGGPYDGTSIQYSYMTGSSTIPAHEVGHGFFLYHTFEGDGGNVSCPADADCLNNGDHVCDTQPHKQSDCGATNPCTGSGTWDNSRFNYMSYCSGLDRFSPGQKARVQAVLQSPPRSTLLQNTTCLGSGINENHSADLISVYPNPVTSVLSVNGLRIKSALKIFDLTGKILLTENAGENYSIDLSGLEKGIYILQSDGVNKKIVKM
ncbi:MAG: zinc-dependent metalloprotease [Bacteroidia bacterium]|nr:zinc-dependent metalloprotease [Bacteroidia bacterium]